MVINDHTNNKINFKDIICIKIYSKENTDRQLDQCCQLNTGNK